MDVGFGEGPVSGTPGAPSSGRGRPAVASAAPALLARDHEVGAVAAAVSRGRPTLVVGPVGMGTSSVARAGAAAAGRACWRGAATAVPGAPGPLDRLVPADLPADPARAADTVVASVGAAVVVLEDLHRASPEVVAAVGCLVGRVTVVATARPGPGLACVLAGLGPGVERIDVGALPAAAAEALVRARSPRLPDDLVAEAVERGGGNPMVLVGLAEAAGRVPAVVRDVVDLDLADLGAPARRALALVALGAAESAPPDDLDELVGRGLVLGPAPRWRVAHAVLAEQSLVGLADEMAGDVHRCAAATVDDPVAVARHLALAGEEAAAHRAALDAVAGLSPDHPVERAEVLVVAARTAADDRWAHAAEAARALLAVGHLDEVRALLDEVGPEAGAPDVAATATWWLLDATTRLADGDVDGAERSIDTGLALEPPASVLGQLLGLRSARRVVGFDPAGARQDLARALDVAPEEPSVGVRARYLLAGADMLVGNDGWWAELEALLADTRRRGDVLVALEIAMLAVYGLFFSGRPEAAREVAASGMAEARRAGLAGRAQHLRGAVAAHEVLVAERVDVQVEVLAQVAADPRVAANRSGHVALWAIGLTDLGRFDEAAAVLGEDRFATPLDRPDQTDGRAGVDHHWAAAELALADLRPVDALAHAERVLVDVQPGRPPGLAAAAVAAWARFLLGRPVPAPGGFVATGLAAPHHEAAGVAALAAGRWDDAVACFERAVAAGDQYLWRSGVRARAGIGLALEQAGDGVGARRARAAALDAAARRGLDGLTTLARRLPPGSSPSGSMSDSMAGLTDRQLQVLALIDRGWSSADIGRLLGLSSSTVDDHARAVRQRLAVPSRSTAAVLARSGSASGGDGAGPVTVLVDVERFGVVARHLTARGWTVGAGGVGPGPSWVGLVADEASAVRLLDQVHGGAAVVVAVDGPLAPAVVDALRRHRRIDDRRGWSTPIDDLPLEVLALARRVADGASVAAAAADVGLSRRTAYRRLAEVGDRLGVHGSRAPAAAVAAWLDQLPAPPR